MRVSIKVQKYHIVTCQQGGVSNKPPGPQAATRHGARDPLVRSLPKNLKKKNGPYTGSVLLRQGEPGTSQYNTKVVQSFPPYEYATSDTIIWRKFVLFLLYLFINTNAFTDCISIPTLIHAFHLPTVPLKQV